MRWTVLLCAAVFFGCDDGGDGGNPTADAGIGAGGAGGVGGAGAAGGAGEGGAGEGGMGGAGEGGMGGAGGMGGGVGEGGAGGTMPACGDGTVDEGETCDDGNTDDDDGCSASCQLECGDGTVSGAEECDDGNTADGDGCSATCTIECGDGELNGVEECDDGNRDPDDGCSATCTLECGDGEVTGAEECDDGNTDADDGCSPTCTLECGDGEVTGAEECDDGNTDADDGCSPTCTLECGDGEVTGAEECDDGNREPDDGCSPACSLDCGDGEVTGAEECDDGNRDADDGCSATCTLECGDGAVTGAEECDDGNRAANDGCSATCTLECGDGAVTGAEECDDGNRESDDGCSETCVIECGDGALNPIEECDDGNRESDDGCSATCTFECGDGAVTGAETCDDGNREPNDGCSENCVLEPPLCGNGFLTLGVEECDDGNLEGGDGCDANCVIEPVDVGEGGTFDGAFAAGALDRFSLTLDQVFTVSAQVEADPACPAAGIRLALFRIDGAARVLQAESADACQPLSVLLQPGEYVYEVRHAEGLPAYQFTVERQTICGNDVLEGDEICDDGNIMGGDGCEADCTLSCGNGVVDPVEECDDGNREDGDGCNAECIDEFTDVSAGGDFPGSVGAGETDLYRLILPEERAVQIVTSDGAGGCPGDTLIGIFLVTPEGPQQVAVVDDGGVAPCAAFDGILAAGTYEIRVLGGAAAAPVPAYTLTVSFGPSCGNGQVEMGEECDDGNDVAGDGCDDQCLLEGLLDISQGGVFPQDGFAAGERDTFRLNMPTNGVVEIATRTADPVCAAADTIVQIINSDGQVVAENDDAPAPEGNRCSAVSADLPPGSYRVVVTIFRDNAAPAYELVVGYASPCGNGSIEVGEQCDDGNQVDGDGCDSQCLNSAVDVSAGGNFPFNIPAQRGNRFRIVLEEQGFVRFRSSDGMGGCPGDSLMRVFQVNPDGSRAAIGENNDDQENPPCSRLEGTITAGIYDIELFNLTDADVQFVLEVQIGGICGDGERTPDEGCDDGNQNDGDSCSATCESEIVDLGTGGVFPAGFGAGQADFFSFVLAAPVEVDLSTDDGNGACPGDTNMLLLVQGPDGGFTPTAQSVTGPLDPCAALRQNLQPGTYVLVVNGPAAVPNYILRADLGAGILDLGAGGAFDRPGFAEGAADLLVMTIDAASTVTLFTGNIDGTPECVAGTDTFISLLDVDEDVIAEDDDADGRGLCSEVSADLQPGTYFLRVRGFNNGVVGPYRITSEILPL